MAINIYAPRDSGSRGGVLLSGGSGVAPKWMAAGPTGMRLTSAGPGNDPVWAPPVAETYKGVYYDFTISTGAAVATKLMFPNFGTVSEPLDIIPSGTPFYMLFTDGNSAASASCVYTDRYGVAVTIPISVDIELEAGKSITMFLERDGLGGYAFFPAAAPNNGGGGGGITLPQIIPTYTTTAAATASKVLTPYSPDGIPPWASLPAGTMFSIFFIYDSHASTDALPIYMRYTDTSGTLTPAIQLSLYRINVAGATDYNPNVIGAMQSITVVKRNATTAAIISGTDNAFFRTSGTKVSLRTESGFRHETIIYRFVGNPTGDVGSTSPIVFNIGREREMTIRVTTLTAVAANTWTPIGTIRNHHAPMTDKTALCMWDTDGSTLGGFMRLDRIGNLSVYSPTGIPTGVYVDASFNFMSRNESPMA
jgi:hypothetical protein